ncbi:hypothetical protein [Neobacillus sp.]|uniref:anti-sigma factor family protein n=1 Tax=Neobacillus sp. TaxID=2675273 RepID=UPI00289EFFB7|nr:hypothetical protein [Neobacillus sp.]
MKHYLYDDWLQYVKNELNDQDREQLESHLYTCDQCLDQYLQAMAENESSLPILTNESGFTDFVMAEVAKQKVSLEHVETQMSPKLELVSKETAGEQSKSIGKANQKKPFYQHAVFHYLLAAVATLLLTFSGAFKSIAIYANSLESPQVQEKKPSMTEGVINKTFAWMDSLEKKEADKK